MPLIGDRLKELRKERGLTQAELAKQLKLSKTAIVQYENNKREPNFDSLHKIVRFFEISTSYLAGDSPYKRLSQQLFSENIKKLSEEILLTDSEDSRRFNVLFGRFYDKISKIFNIDEIELKTDILRDLDAALSIVYHIALGTVSLSREMYDNGLMDELAYYQLIEKDYRSTVHDLEHFLISMFKHNFKKKYKNYVSKFSLYYNNEDELSMIQSINDELEAYGIDKYSRLK